MGIEQNPHGLRLPSGQLALRERFEEAVIDDDPIPQRAEPARAPALRYFTGRPKAAIKALLAPG